MKLLITGGGGFLGARLARTLLARGELAGQRIERMVLTDIAPPPSDLLADKRVEARTGPLLSQTEALKSEPFDGVFHLASAVSGECEADFQLGMTSNLDSTRALLDALRARVEAGSMPTRLVFSSSIAVFGPDPGVTFPGIVADDTLPTPQTSYGTQKLICEHLLADYTRKGYVDGRAARLMTVTVRPGRPNGAASSFFSGIIREPLAGVEAICPVSPDVSHPMSSPTRTVEGLIAVYEASREAFAGAPRSTCRGSTCACPTCSMRWKKWPDRRCARAFASSATSALPASWPTGPRAQRLRGRQGWGFIRTRTSPRSFASTSTTAAPHPTPTKP